MRVFHATSALMLAALLGASAPAGATTIRTMTFTGLPEAPPDWVSVWVEDGITAVAVDGPVAGFGVPGTVHLDGPGTTPFASKVDFTTGSLFAPISIDILPGGSAYCSIGTFPDFPPECSARGEDPADYIAITGFLDDVVVGTVELYRPPDDVFETISLEALPLVDRLRVETRTPSQLGLTGTCDVGRGCGHYSFDNVRLRDAGPGIPEPSAALVFGLGVLCAGLVRPRPARR